jgi:asparagine synthase (glutamine-hydrolysing)
MCGIAGIWDSRPARLIAEIAAGMGARLAHRGPDDSGLWLDRLNGVALAHRRLSIIDLSPAGHQPMESSDRRYVITYNGELYNFRALRAEVERDDQGLRWRSSCDTEVILEAVRVWGIDTALRRFNGMFAFAVWDRSSCVLTLARDRLGEKPLFYGYQQGSFVFCSELKALGGLPGWTPQISEDGLELYFRFGSVPGPTSIVKGIHKLKPGCYVQISANGLAAEEVPPPVAYWSLYEIAACQYTGQWQRDEGEYVRELERTLNLAVGRQLVSDVPVGALLSGGIDSSIVVSMMQRNSSRRVQTYTVAFYEDAFSEGAYAREVARYLGTDHTELFVTASDALDVITKLPEIYDEPLSDTSQIPTYLVAQLASRYVKVCLSGDGGDELFGGYNRHVWGARLQRAVRFFSPELRQTITARLGGYLSRMRSERVGAARLFGAIGVERAQKVLNALSSASAEDVYLNLVSHWNPGDTPLLNHKARDVRPASWHDFGDAVRTMMFADAMSYMPDDVLVKLDRAAMATSLETRAPMLDKDVVELAYSIPARRHIGWLTGKKLLRSVLYRQVPRKLVDRPKAGFHLPIADWLRGPLRDWVEDLISSRSMALHGLLDEERVQRTWREHLSGRRDFHAAIWDILTFQSWWTAYRQDAGGPSLEHAAKDLPGASMLRSAKA